MAQPAIKRAEIFGTPTWRTTVPQFVTHHGRVVAAVKERWDAGLFEEHRYGYGYNTPTDIFSEESLEANPHYRILLDGFRAACTRILDKREGYAQKTAYEINTVQAWIRLQTPEERGFPWHHHIPAVLSGCYFVTVPGPLPEGEGDLMFQDSAPGCIFKSSYTSIRPEVGDLIIFPSHLQHMPTPSPHAKEWRIGVNMDAYVEWTR